MVVAQNSVPMMTHRKWPVLRNVCCIRREHINVTNKGSQGWIKIRDLYSVSNHPAFFSRTRNVSFPVVYNMRAIYAKITNEVDGRHSDAAESWPRADGGLIRGCGGREWAIGKLGVGDLL
jgi:hypothetical protein